MTPTGRTVISITLLGSNTPFPLLAFPVALAFMPAPWPNSFSIGFWGFVLEFQIRTKLFVDFVFTIEYSYACQPDWTVGALA
jgi:hypothetical protein